MFYRTVEVEGQRVKVSCFPVDSYETVEKMARKQLGLKAQDHPESRGWKVFFAVIAAMVLAAAGRFWL